MCVFFYFVNVRDVVFVRVNGAVFLCFVVWIINYEIGYIFVLFLFLLFGLIK